MMGLAQAALGALRHDSWRSLIGSFGDRRDRANWDRARALFAEKFRTRTRAEWCRILEGTDACFAPVLTPAEAVEHEHLRARGTFVEVDGVVQPAPAPRFSRTVPRTPQAPSAPDAEQALAGWLPPKEIARWRQEGVL